MYEDTDPETMRVWCQMMRDAPPGRKMDRVASLIRLVRANARRAVREAHPGWSRQRADVEFVRIHYGEDLARGVAGRLGVDLD